MKTVQRYNKDSNPNAIKSWGDEKFGLSFPETGTQLIEYVLPNPAGFVTISSPELCTCQVLVRAESIIPCDTDCDPDNGSPAPCYTYFLTEKCAATTYQFGAGQKAKLEFAPYSIPRTPGQTFEDVWDANASVGTRPDCAATLVFDVAVGSDGNVIACPVGSATEGKKVTTPSAVKAKEASK